MGRPKKSNSSETKYTTSAITNIPDQDDIFPEHITK